MFKGTIQHISCGKAQTKGKQILLTTTCKHVNQLSLI